MASASEYGYVRKDAPKGQVRYRVFVNPPPGSGMARETHTAFFTSQKKALAWGSSREAQWRQAYAEPAPVEAITVSAWWDTILMEGYWPLSEKAVDSRDREMRNYVLPRWGDTPLDGLLTTEIKAWLGRLVTGPKDGDRSPRYPGWALTPISPGSAQHVKATLSRLLGLAVEHDLLDINRSLAAKAPPKRHAIPRFVLIEDVHAAMQYLPEWLRAPVQVLTLTGLRLGELRAMDELSWQPGARSVAIDRVIVQLGHKRFGWRGVTKGLRFRHVPVVDAVSTAITEHAKRFPPVRQHVTGTVDSGLEGPGADPMLWFTMPDGTPLLEQTVLKAWDAAQVAAGLTRQATVHGLRHTFASHLITQGTTLASLAVLMGHSQTRTTELYGWLTDLDHAAVRAILDDAAAGFLAGRNTYTTQ